MTQFCPNCADIIPDNELICANCGCLPSDVGAPERHAPPALQAEGPVLQNPESKDPIAEQIGLDLNALPIIRFRRTSGGRRKFVMITEHSLLIGRIRGAREQTLQNLARHGHTGEIRDGETLPPHRRLSLDSIRRVSRTRLRGRSKATTWLRFQVDGEAASCHFDVREDQAENVQSALKALLGARFDPTAHEEWSGQAINTLVWYAVAALALALAAVALLMNAARDVLFPYLGWGAAVLAALLVAKASHDYWRGGASQARPAAARKQQRSRPAGQQPFHDALVGWVFKIAGVGWLLMVILLPLLLIQERYSAALDKRVWYQNELTTDDKREILRWLQPLLALPGIGLLYLGYRFCVRPFEPGEHPDPRAPIIYLRGFADDGFGSYQPDTFLASCHGIEAIPWRKARTLGRRRIPLPGWVFNPVKIVRLLFNANRQTAEEVLVGGFSEQGPLIAVGRPGEVLATPGAPRMYLTDETWQQTVLECLGRCQAVVLQPSESEGVRWEMERVFDLVERHRILLSVSRFHGRPNEYEWFRGWLRTHYGLELPLSIPFVTEPGFVYFEPDGTARIQPICYTSPMLWSFTGNAVDMSRTLATFIQGLQGKPRELPLQSKKRRIATIASLMIPSFPLILLCLPFLGLLAVQRPIPPDRPQVRPIQPPPKFENRVPGQFQAPDGAQ
jgi:hypothetical protein